MNFRIFYGSSPKLTQADRHMFTRGGYVCRKLLQTRKGEPVGISRSMDSRFPVWKVEHGFSCMVFASYEDAMAYCRGRFYDLDGKEV